MQRLASVLLAAFAVVVLAGAIWVIADNSAPDSGKAQPTPSFPSQSVPAPSGSAGSTTPSGSGSAATSTNRVVAFIGDDWTVGKGASGRKKRFTSLICDRLGLTEMNVAESGTGYAGADGYRDQVDAAVKADPVLVVVSGGRDDVVDDDAKAAISGTGKLFAELHRRLPDATIVAITPFWGDSDPPNELLALTDSVKKAVEKNGGTYLAVVDPLNGHPNWMANDADPGDEGHKAIADAIAPRLNGLLPG